MQPKATGSDDKRQATEHHLLLIYEQIAFRVTQPTNERKKTNKSALGRLGNPQEVRWEDWERRPVGFTPQRRIKGGGVRRPGAQTGCSSVSGLRVEFCQPPPPLTLGSEAQPIGGRDGGLVEGGGEGGRPTKLGGFVPHSAGPL